MKLIDHADLRDRGVFIFEVPPGLSDRTGEALLKAMMLNSALFQAVPEIAPESHASAGACSREWWVVSSVGTEKSDIHNLVNRLGAELRAFTRNPELMPLRAVGHGSKCRSNCRSN